jgi:hypothetical protein
MSSGSTTTSDSTRMAAPGLGARLEAKLDEAARRTQALADAVEAAAAAGAGGGGPSNAVGAGGLPIPTPLRSLVAQLQRWASEKGEGGAGAGGGGEPGRPDRGRRAAPLLVELRGAGLERGGLRYIDRVHYQESIR